jgi:hypothetical protein
MRRNFCEREKIAQAFSCNQWLSTVLGGSNRGFIPIAPPVPRWKAKVFCNQMLTDFCAQIIEDDFMQGVSWTAEPNTVNFPVGNLPKKYHRQGLD